MDGIYPFLYILSLALVGGGLILAYRNRHTLQNARDGEVAPVLPKNPAFQFIFYILFVVVTTGLVLFYYLKH